jgi:hypothetical protein
MPKFLLILTSLLLSQAILAARCEEQKDINLTFPAASFNELRLNALAGDLHIEAGDVGQIKIEGIACSDEAEALDRMDIDVVENGSILELTVIIPYHERDWDADYAHIDLYLEVPASLVNLVRDSSGDFAAEGVTLARLEDSSGDIRLRNTRGELSLRDSSGDITIRGHAGELSIEDSSGDIDVSDISGSIVVERDSSGDIEIEQVSGLVTILQDSSGDIEIEEVGKSVIVAADGGGSIRIQEVRGSVEIGADGSGNVTVKSIDGDFTVLTKGSGDIRTSAVKGNINIPLQQHIGDFRKRH